MNDISRPQESLPSPPVWRRIPGKLLSLVRNAVKAALEGPEPPAPLTRELAKKFLDEYYATIRSLSRTDEGAPRWTGIGSSFQAFDATIVNYNHLWADKSPEEQSRIRHYLLEQTGLLIGA